jgi:hypothetical protein
MTCKGGTVPRRAQLCFFCLVGLACRGRWATSLGAGELGTGSTAHSVPHPARR